jgi:hypothetical protein
MSSNLSRGRHLVDTAFITSLSFMGHSRYRRAPSVRLPSREHVGPDTPLRLHVAAAIAYPMGRCRGHLGVARRAFPLEQSIAASPPFAQGDEHRPSVRGSVKG